MNYRKIMRDLREDADMTQQQIAEVLGTSQTMYARYERGANDLPIRHLITLCNFYHVSADYFLGLNDKNSESIKDRKKLLTSDNAALLNRFEEFLLYEQRRKKQEK